MFWATHLSTFSSHERESFMLVEKTEPIAFTDHTEARARENHFHELLAKLTYVDATKHINIKHFRVILRGADALTILINF